MIEVDNGDRITYSFEFPLMPGALSWIEQSDDLQTWIPTGAYWWGFNSSDAGQWPLFSVSKPAPGGQGPLVPVDPNYVAPTHVTMLLEFSSTGIIGNWTSLDDTNADYSQRDDIRYQFGGIVGDPSLWGMFPLYAEQYGDFHFVLLNYRTESPQNPIAPPYNPQLGPKDAAMVAEFTQAIPLIEIKMADSATVAQNSPPPPPPSADSKSFWKVEMAPAVSLDSDGDGLSNQWEIDNGTNWLAVDSDLDGLWDNVDGNPLENEALNDPDGANHGYLNDTPAEGGNLVGRWDFEDLISDPNDGGLAISKCA